MGNNIAHTLNHSPFARRLQNCGGMADADLGALDGIHQDLVRLGKGETLATAGHAPDRILVIEDGWAFRFQLLDDGGRQITEILAPGDMLNCEALSRLSPGHAAEALTPVTMRAFQAQEFLKTVQTTPGIAAALWWSEFQIDNMLREQITRLGRRDAQSRIAHFFLELLMRARCAGVIRGGMIEAPLSQSHLADLLGLTADCLAQTGDVFEALDLRRDVLARREALSGPKGRAATDAKFDLAVLLNSMGRYEDAEAHLRPVLRRYERDFGFHGEWTIKCAEQMALGMAAGEQRCERLRQPRGGRVGGTAQLGGGGGAHRHREAEDEARWPVGRAEHTHAVEAALAQQHRVALAAKDVEQRQRDAEHRRHLGAQCAGWVRGVAGWGRRGARSVSGQGRCSAASA